VQRSAGSVTRVVLGLALVLAVAYGARLLAERTHPALEFDVGPSTGAYLEGFTESEERVPVTFRWTRERAQIGLPVDGAGADAVLSVRFARFLDGNASVRVFIDGDPQGSFSARSGRFRTLELPIRLDGGSPTIAFLVDDPNPERLGIAIDWIRIENARWHIPNETLRPTVLLVGVFLLTLALGRSHGTAVALGVGVAIVQAAWVGHDPFAMVHTHDQLTVIGLAASSLVALTCITAGRARALPLLFLIGYLLKGAALFHPSYWYPDVRLHRRYVEAFAAAEGSFVERGLDAQKSSGTAYPRQLGGKNYAMPYSPLFYLPFTLVDGDARSLESTMKHVGLLLASAEVLLVYILASYLLGARVALIASALAIFLPPMMSRLLFAQWPTLAGHLLDTIAILFGASVLKHLDRRRWLIGYGASVLTAFVSYISSLFTLSFFTCGLALVARRRALSLLLVAAAAGVTTIALLYLQFVRAVVTEILPAISQGAASAGSEAIGPMAVLARIPLFYGYGFPLFAIAGLILARRSPSAFKTLVAYGFAFTALLALRSISGAFKDLKELVFIGPFVAIATGVCLESLAARGRSGRFAAVAVTCGLAAFGLSKLAEYAWFHTRLAGLD